MSKTNLSARALTRESQKAAEELLALGSERFARSSNPPWRFQNRTGKMRPSIEAESLRHDGTRRDHGIARAADVDGRAHCTYGSRMTDLEGLEVMKRWGFNYKTNIIWYKTRRMGAGWPRRRLLLPKCDRDVAVWDSREEQRTLGPGRTQTNIIATRKREHSRKPDEQYALVERCSPGPYLESSRDTTADAGSSGQRIPFIGPKRRITS